MTEQEYKRKQSLLQDLQAELKNYRKDEQAKNILAQERLIGKCYTRVNSEDRKTEYLKVISALTAEAPHTLHTLVFALPATLKMDHISRHRLHAETDSDNFNYNFYDEDFIWTEKIHENDLWGYDEIGLEGYNKALEDFFKQITEITKKTFTLASVLGEDYANKIKEQNNKED